MAIIVTASLLVTITAVDTRGQHRVRFQAHTLSFKEPNKDWLDIQTNQLITIDLDTRTITVYAKEEQVYDITSVTEPYIDKDGDRVVDFSTIDNKGKQCLIRVLERKDGSVQLQALYPTYTWVFTVTRK